MINWLNNRGLESPVSITWGCGSSRHGEKEPWGHPEGYALAGVREWSEDRERAGLWAPCASCMSPLFDVDYEIKHEAVLFVNASEGIRTRYPVAVGLQPFMKNDRPMDEIVAFLGSAEVIVTDSYHGILWGTLLGRKVVAVPYSSKFYGFRHPPAYSRNGGLDWRAEALGARIYPGALEECRSASRAFYKRALGAVR